MILRCWPDRATAATNCASMYIAIPIRTFCRKSRKVGITAYADEILALATVVRMVGMSMYEACQFLWFTATVANCVPCHAAAIGSNFLVGTERLVAVSVDCRPATAGRTRPASFESSGDARRQGRHRIDQLRAVRSLDPRPETKQSQPLAARKTHAFW